MPSIIQQSQLITILRTATEAEQGIQEWTSSHAGPDQNQAKKALTAPGRDITYIGGDLCISVARTEQQEQANQCSIYAIQYSNPGIRGLAYAAYALIIFPRTTLAPGPSPSRSTSPTTGGTQPRPGGTTGNSRRKG